MKFIMKKPFEDNKEKHIKSHRILLQVLFLMVLVAAFMLVRSYENPRIQTMGGQTASQGGDPLERIKSLEPDTPLDIKDPPFLNPPMPSEVKPMLEVMEKGREIAWESVYSNSEWKRPAYRSYWHSTVSAGRWSYVPTRIHFGMHRLFTTYPTASVYYDFIHDLGIAEESKDIQYDMKSPFEKIETVVMQAEVKKVLTMGNQVVVIGKPQRNGLQVLTIPVESIKPTKPEDHILFQLATPEGDEIDYNLISYARWK
ncbi:MAG: hypothetical protein N2484_08970 [Clostridia bacterium]|nr:hypothetical protein [Clostridia bacterium]